ncbi:MAG: 4,5-DOPA dioxygenase extradiol [Bacteroidota bacterium]
MDRKKFLQVLSSMPASGLAKKVADLKKITASLPSSGLMPVLFLGHGSPMNALDDSQYVQGWKMVGLSVPNPKAILCISAHWETNGTYVTAMEHPRTIHDFGGFPRELFEVQYPAPGSPELAKEVVNLVTKNTVGPDEQWGLDHGCWSLLKVLYPKADIPVIQMSLDYSQPAQYHYDLGRELASLRKKGVLIIGSGNLVHNLGMVAWEKIEEAEYGFDWALEADATMKKFIVAGDHRQLVDYKSQGKAFDLAIPTPEHFLPLLYILALQEEQDNVYIFNDKVVLGSLSMTCVKIG